MVFHTGYDLGWEDRGGVSLDRSDGLGGSAVWDPVADGVVGITSGGAWVIVVVGLEGALKAQRY